MSRIATLFQAIALMVITATAAMAEVATMTPDEAYQRALAGEIVLIDIRTPGEWAQTGLPDVALKADMSVASFIPTILNIRDQNPDIPLAMICRTGNRSGYVTGELFKAGMTNVIDVVEGMAGSGVGPGWVTRGLPVRATDLPANAEIIAVQP